LRHEDAIISQETRRYSIYDRVRLVSPVTIVEVPLAEILEQAFRRLLHQVEHVLEAVRAAVARVGNLPLRGVRGEVEGVGDTAGVYNNDSSPTIKQSTLIGSTNSLNQTFDGTAKVADTQLVGPVSNDSATGAALQCFNNYDENLAAVTCP
jgi:hypothetical protein